MKYVILTIFKEMFDILDNSILKRAKDNNIIDTEIIDIRDFSTNKHKKVDLPPYGGGAGMVMTPEPIISAYESIDENIRKNAKTIYLSPKGKVLTQEKVIELSKEENLILLCGHYEGVDQRVIDEIVDEEISVGDYVLTGGELPAMIVIDSVSRYIEGVISKDSLADESLTNNILEYPQYTRPENFRGRKVPQVLLEGNHKKIEDYRRKESLKITYEKRPELLKKADKNNNLSIEDKKYLEKLKQEENKTINEITNRMKNKEKNNKIN